MSKRSPKIRKVFWALPDRQTKFLFSNGAHLASLLRFLLAVSGRFGRLSYSAMLCLCAWNGKQCVPGTGPAPPDGAARHLAVEREAHEESGINKRSAQASRPSHMHTAIWWLITRRRPRHKAQIKMNSCKIASIVQFVNALHR